jgi:hypothetical protein
MQNRSYRERVYYSVTLLNIESNDNFPWQACRLVIDIIKLSNCEL